MRIVVVLLLLVSGCLTSCTSTLQNEGRVGFEYSTSFAFFHRAAKTSGGDQDNVAQTNTEFPALVSWFLTPTPSENGETVIVTP
jgi:hypothetical protein